MIADAILAIFVLTYVGMAIGRIPGLRTDRAGLAPVAAVLMIVVTGVIADLPATQQLFRDLIDFGLLPDRLSVLMPLTLTMSNTIGSVPSDFLLLQVGDHPPQEALYALALLSTFAGNLLLTGSLANLILAERAAAVGASLPFLAHARAGIPITILTSAVAALWLWLAGVVPL